MAKKEKKKSTFFADFKKFLMEGNAVSMAVGVIIGAAMKDLVTSLVDNIFNPIIGAVVGDIDFSSSLILKMGESQVKFGAFLTTLINFVIMAFVVFLLVRCINKLSDSIKKVSILKAEEEAPTTKKCPYCLSEIDIKAVKCPHCTSDIKE